MAYPDQPYGFIPLRHKSGAPYSGAARPYWIDAADTPGDGLYMIGDPVVQDGTANTAALSIPGMGEFAIGMLPGVTRVTAGQGAGNRVTGVVVGVGADTRDSLVYRADVTERVVWVADDPDLVFSVQADAAFAVANIGANSNILFDTAGDTSTGRSGAEADATVETDAASQLKVLGFVNDPENEPNSVGNRLEVIFCLHTMGPAGGNIGV